jgi:hypothetical protein
MNLSIICLKNLPLRKNKRYQEVRRPLVKLFVDLVDAAEVVQEDDDDSVCIARGTLARFCLAGADRLG